MVIIIISPCLHQVVHRISGEAEALGNRWSAHSPPLHVETLVLAYYIQVRTEKDQ